MNKHPRAWHNINRTDIMQNEISPVPLNPQEFSSTFLKRFWSKVDKNGPIPQHKPELGPCWVWTGAKMERGYGCIFKGLKHAKPVNIKSTKASWLIQ